MIKEVKLYLELFFQAELDAHNAKRVPDLNLYNEKIEKMYSYVGSELTYRLNISPAKELRDQSFYERVGNKKFQYPRFLFKLSQYDHPDYGDLYLAYVTLPALQYDDYLKLADCLFVRRVEGELKIVGKSFVNNENPRRIVWREGLFDTGLTFKTSGTFVGVERYIEPEFDEFAKEYSQFSIDEYNKDR